MQQETEKQAEGVVIPLVRESTAAPAIPAQRGVPAAQPRTAEPLGDLSHDAAAALMAIESPDRFFSGFAHALWMSAALVVLALAVLSATGIVG